MSTRRRPAKSSQQRTALITGASRGLGRAVAGFLAGSGLDLILSARTRSELDETAIELRHLGGSVLSAPGDLRSAPYRSKLESLVQELGSLDILLNNASELGPSPLPPLARYPLPRLRDVFEVNVIAPLALVQSLRPQLSRARGLVVNISSDAAVAGYPGWGGYGASKAALDLLTRTLAEELKPDRISVVSVDPGDLRTQMHQDAYPGEDISDRPLPEVTLPFWAWLFGQRPGELSGRRFKAQANHWEAGS